jgi:hypothetical protein
MIPLTPFPLSRVARKNLQSQQTIQILTLRRAFLTASSNRTLDNENHGGKRCSAASCSTSTKLHGRGRLKGRIVLFTVSEEAVPPEPTQGSAEMIP